MWSSVDLLAFIFGWCSVQMCNVMERDKRSAFLVGSSALLHCVIWRLSRGTVPLPNTPHGSVSMSPDVDIGDPEIPTKMSLLGPIELPNYCI